MKALVLVSNGKFEFRDVPVPERPGPGWVLLRISAAGVCGSDLPRAFSGGAYHYPLIMGHELSCVVAEDAPAAGFSEGDRVAVFPLIPCYSCGPCRTGDYAQCESYDYLGSRRDGGFAELMWAPAINLFPLPEGLNADHAAMTEPGAVALHAVKKAEPKAGESAVVYGCGPIGNLAAQWLRLSGCDPVYTIDIDRRKLDIAREMDFEIIDAGKSDPVEQLRRIHGDRGAEIVVEAVGLPKTFLQAVKSAGRFGRVVFLGTIKGEFRIGESDFSDILRKELTIRGTWNSKIFPRGSDDWSATLHRIGRGIDVGPLISHRVSLEKGGQTFEMMHHGHEHYNKVLLVPGG